MGRPIVWLQLLLGWLPIGALFALLILSAHRDVHPREAIGIALRMMVSGALLGLVVHRFARRVPWPSRVRLSFVAAHVLGAATYAVAFVALNSIFASIVVRRLVIVYGGAGVGGYVVMGVWLYCMIVGAIYASDATARVARAEAAAAESQLAALRAQLNPHFLFNALHTVVQLIPLDPPRAAKAAEEVAGLLRATLEEDRDVVAFAEELAFVRRYLAIERIRFGERLVIREDVAPAALDARVPVFALQTLVENAVRHGAAPRPDPTTIDLVARVERGRLTVTVRDTGAGASPEVVASSAGTGLARVRDQLAVLYGQRAQLATQSTADGFTATIALPYGADE